MLHLAVCVLSNVKVAVPPKLAKISASILPANYIMHPSDQMILKYKFYSKHNAISLSDAGLFLEF